MGLPRVQADVFDRAGGTATPLGANIFTIECASAAKFNCLQHERKRNKGDTMTISRMTTPKFAQYFVLSRSSSRQEIATRISSSVSRGLSSKRFTDGLASLECSAVEVSGFAITDPGHRLDDCGGTQSCDQSQVVVMNATPPRWGIGVEPIEWTRENCALFALCLFV